MKRLIDIFNKKTRDLFNPFITEYNFNIVKDEIDFIRFENSNVFIEISYDGKKSYEIGFCIGLIKQEHLEFHADLLFSFYKVKLPGFSITEEEGFDRFFRKTINLLKNKAKNILEGDIKEYQKIGLFKDNETKKYNIELQLRQAQSKANKAWSEKDYFSIVEALEPIKNYLSLADLKKLNYAKKYLGV